MSNYRIVGNGVEFKVQKFMTVGCGWFRKSEKEWVDIGINCGDGEYPVTFPTIEEAREHLKFKEARSNGWAVIE